MEKMEKRIGGFIDISRLNFNLPFGGEICVVGYGAEDTIWFTDIRIPFGSKEYAEDTAREILGVKK
jgi:hypothetical protein